MSDFFPLIVDASGTPAIKEIPSGDVLDLTGVTVKAVSVDTTLAVAGASTLTGNTTVGGTLGVTGVVTANAGVVVDTITIDAGQIDQSSGDLTLDVAGDIILDADGTQIILKDGGTEFGHLYNTNNDFGIKSTISDKDIKFVGNDNGSVFTALTLDMSEAGAATFNAGVTATTGTYSGLVTMGGIEVDQYVTHAGDTNTYLEFGTDQVDLRAGNVKGLVLKTSEVVINEDSADLDFRVEGNGFANLIFANAGTDRVGIGTATPSTLLDVQGDVSTAGSITAAQSAKITQQPLATSGSTISWNALTHANAFLIPSVNLTIDNPSNSVEGAIISVEIAMNGTPRTIAWNTVFEFAASTPSTVTPTANKTDIFSFRYNGSVWQEIGRVQNLAQT
jgi:hypothetical protein